MKYIRFSCCPNCKKPLHRDSDVAVEAPTTNNNQPSSALQTIQGNSNDVGDANRFQLTTCNIPSVPVPGIRQRVKRRGHYDKMVVLSRKQIPLAKTSIVGSCDIRKSTRISKRIRKPVDLFNYGNIKCPACKRKFTEIFPVAFYDGFVACSTNCYIRAFNP